MALIRVRRGSASAWATANPILASGEFGYDETNEITKIGNGADAWTDLDQIASGGGGGGGPVAWADVEGKPEEFPPSAHNHDGRYYTETEADALLLAKADDNAVVKLSGAQSVAGTKTFTSIPVLPNSSPSTDNEAARKKYVDDGLATKAASNHSHTIGDVSGLQSALDDKVEADELISADEDNAASAGSDGGVFVSPAQPPGDYPENSDIEALLKYAAPVWVLEFDEDENDLPEDFPTAPLFAGGPPPIVLRKKDD